MLIKNEHFEIPSWQLHFSGWLVVVEPGGVGGYRDSSKDKCKTTSIRVYR